MSAEVPMQLHHGLEQEQEVQVNQLLQIIQSQRMQLQQSQQQQSSNERIAHEGSIENDLRSRLPPDFPWDFEPKWPLTHAERITELDELSRYYDKTHHKDNIRAAKEYHARFPPTDLVPAQTIWFRDGKQATKAEINLKGGVIWSEHWDLRLELWTFAIRERLFFEQGGTAERDHLNFVIPDIKAPNMQRFALAITSRLGGDQQTADIPTGRTRPPLVTIEDDVEEPILDTPNTANSVLGDDNPADDLSTTTQNNNIVDGTTIQDDNTIVNDIDNTTTVNNAAI
ncbi:hypothetical protein DTO212C5_1798 [Paecilomyces variotii]|nr:hypothetical protein DTO212C5_1798 [Paecilomyces variotii]